MAQRKRKDTHPDHGVGNLGSPVEVLGRAIREVLRPVQELFGYPAGDGDVDCRAEGIRGFSMEGPMSESATRALTARNVLFPADRVLVHARHLSRHR
jgi:hypothetical protein